MADIQIDVKIRASLQGNTSHSVKPLAMLQDFTSHVAGSVSMAWAGVTKVHYGQIVHDSTRLGCTAVELEMSMLKGGRVILCNQSQLLSRSSSPIFMSRIARQ